MAASIQSIEKDQSAIERSLHPRGSHARHEFENNRFRLLNLLQSTLDLKTLLRYFLESLRKELPVGGLSYEDESRNTNIRIGKQSTHSCGYRLTTVGIECGEIVFKRDSRFSEEELLQIEQSIVLLLAPISNAIKYADAVDFANKNIAKQLIDRETLGITLHREIELAKRHNHSLTIANISVKTKCLTGKVNRKDPRIEEFADYLYQEKDTTQMLYRTGEREFLLIAASDSETTTRGLNSILLSNIQGFDETGAPELTFSVGYAQVTGTDSVTSVIGRARKNTAKLQ